jgi:hypothetical protein
MLGNNELWLLLSNRRLAGLLVGSGAHGSPVHATQLIMDVTLLSIVSILQEGCALVVEYKSLPGQKVNERSVLALRDEQEVSHARTILETFRLHGKFLLHGFNKLK